MSGVGFSELIILFLIGLIVLGPERLPRVANQLGSWIGQARRMTRVMRRQLEDELNIQDDITLRPPSQSKASPDYDIFEPPYDDKKAADTSADTGDPAPEGEDESAAKDKAGSDT